MAYFSTTSQKCSINSTYTTAAARNKALLFFAINIGYIGGEYKVYKPIDNHYVWQHDSRLNWIGPTKAEISLVFLLGRNGGSAKKKGGER